MPRRVMAAYGAPSFALALLGVSVFVHVPRFSGDVAGASLSAIGSASHTPSAILSLEVLYAGVPCLHPSGRAERVLL